MEPTAIPAIDPAASCDGFGDSVAVGVAEVVLKLEDVGGWIGELELELKAVKVVAVISVDARILPVVICWV